MYLGLRGNTLVAAVGFCCGSGFLLLGYDQGVMGGVVGYSGNTFAQTFDNPDATITGLMVSSYSRAQFIVGRIIAGVGNGMNTSTLGIYQSETCPAKNRGKVVTCEGIMAIGGVWVSYWLDFGMYYTDSTAQWRFPLAFPAVFALAMSGVAFFMPESPRWLVLKKRDEEAKQVLAALAGANVPNGIVFH
ncbi:general substrate transporter [Penicillium canescens]|nr:general substrate transporter [Penicillium canescens]